MKEGLTILKVTSQFPFSEDQMNSKMSLSKLLFYLDGKETNQQKIVGIGIVNPLSSNFIWFNCMSFKSGHIEIHVMHSPDFSTKIPRFLLICVVILIVNFVLLLLLVM